MNFSLRDFTATEMAVQMGNTVRLVSWAGIRHMITEVRAPCCEVVCIHAAET